MVRSEGRSACQNQRQGGGAGQTQGVIRLTAEARTQFLALLDHYETLERFEASQSLVTAVELASNRIEQNPTKGLPAPRPYPKLKKADWLWTKVGVIGSPIVTRCRRSSWLFFTTQPIFPADLRSKQTPTDKIFCFSSSKNKRVLKDLFSTAPPAPQ